MAKKVMGETKKTSSRRAAKPAAKTTARTAKAATSKKTVSAKKSVSKKSAEASVLEIADHGVISQVSEKITKNLKQSEHWHAGIFVVIVILAAYFSYQASNPATTSTPNPVPVNTQTDEEVEDDPGIVYSFNFPADYAWLTLNTGEDVSVAPGGSGEFVMQVRNTGKATWYRDADAAFRLGTLNPADEQIPFQAVSVAADGSTREALGRNRVEMDQAQVAPGETATFRLRATAVDWEGNNLTPGSYPITVGFLVEGQGSLSKNPLVWLLNVR